MKTHFTRNWEHILCNSTIDCEDKPVVSDPKLLAAFMDDWMDSRSICVRCLQRLTPDERMVMAQRITERSGAQALTGAVARFSTEPQRDEAEGSDD
ncbi:MAG: hypothetical protein ACYTEX_11000 [Planctomycetota bacterium]|jgi:hypothetical protein